MKYRELLELYKQGKLEAEKLQQVEQDIERHEAISEYLFEEDIPELDALLHGTQPITNKSRIHRLSDGASMDATDLKFARMIHRSIRRAFVKLGVTVVAIVVAFILFAQFALPHIVDAMYYQPDKIIAGDTKQFDLDMAVYTELFVPNQRRMTTMVESNGFGEYDFVVYQNYSVNRNFVDAAGKMDKGEIIFYNYNVMAPPTGNAFAWSGIDLEYNKGPLSEQINPNSNAIYAASGSPKDARKTLEELEEGVYYNAFVSLDSIMDYEDFVAYIDKCGDSLMGVWCAPLVSDHFSDCDNIGFFYHQSAGAVLDWDNEAYPNLLLSDAYFEDRLDMDVETNAIEHFTSMLQYMDDQEAFSEMLNVNNKNYEAKIAYVQEHGLKIYGYMTVADKEQLLKLMDQEEVYTIYTTVAR